MENFVIVGDCHFGKKLHVDGFLDYQISEFLKIIDYCAENQINNIIQLGDWFDNRTSIDFKLVQRINHEIIQVLEEQKISVYYCAGNHDIYYKNENSINSVKLLFGESDVFHIVSDYPEEVDNILIVPWISQSNQTECLKAIKNTNCDICVGHFDIAGFEMSKGYLNDKGMSKSIFKKFKKVYSGHFHLKGKQGNIEYVGSMCQLDWGDFEDAKQIIVFQNDKFESVQLTRELFHKIELPNEINSDDFDKCILKIYLNDKLDKKQNTILDNLIEHSILYETIDNSIILNDNQIDEVENESMENIFTDYLSEQSEIDETDKQEINKLFLELFNETRGLSL